MKQFELGKYETYEENKNTAREENGAVFYVE